MKTLFLMFYVIFCNALRVCSSLLAFLAGSAQTSPDTEQLSSAVRGGVINYRTGKLDDGTDPYGWYDDD